MKRVGSLVLVLWLSLFSHNLWSQCAADGNIAVFSNYDGGYLTINVDQDIPDLKIGVVSYEPISVNFVGPFVNNITEVVYAGYQPQTGTGNFHCDNNLAITSIASVPNGTVTILNQPTATLADPNGNPSIICSYSCNTSSGQGGCNTTTQVEAFFSDYFGSNLLFNKTQYACWCGVQDLSIPNDCCASVNSSSGAAVNITASPGVICDGEPVVLDAGPGYDTYAWSTGETTQSITVAVAGNYSVDVTNTCGDASDTYEVLAGENPIVNATIIPDYGCTDGSIDIQITNVPQSPTPHTFAFFQQGTGNAIPSNGGSVSSLDGGDYGCLITDANGCTTLFSFTIDQEDPVLADFTVSDASCIGGLGSAMFDLIFNVIDTYSYEVFDNTGATVIGGTVAGNTLDVQGLAPGLYILAVNGVNTGCMEVFNFVVGGASGFEINSVVEDISCAGETDGNISVIVDGTNGPFDFIWEDETGAVIGMENEVSDLLAGIYTANISDQGGCFTAVEYTILEPAPLALSINLNQANCVDSMALLLASGGGGTQPYFYVLNDTLSQGDSIFQLKVSDLEQKLTLIDANGCEVSNDTILVEPYEFPPAIITASPDLDFQPLGEEFSLSVISTDEALQTLDFSWEPGLLVDCDTCATVNTSITKPTQFLVFLKYPDGCAQALRRTMLVEVRRRIYAPNIFKPDFDGINDYFEIFPSLEIERFISLQIFDRWGALVYQNIPGEERFRWDGTIGGQRAPTGVYSWVLETLFIDGDYRIFSGDVILMR
ncbi:MAG: gliding motility-associated C-terminal domain-containing protein [Bacteroidota bacterium]